MVNRDTLPPQQAITRDEGPALLQPTAVFTSHSVSRPNFALVIYRRRLALLSQAIVTVSAAALISFNQGAFTSLPEPAALAILGLGLVALAGYARRGLPKREYKTF